MQSGSLDVTRSSFRLEQSDSSELKPSVSDRSLSESVYRGVRNGASDSGKAVRTHSRGKFLLESLAKIDQSLDILLVLFRATCVLLPGVPSFFMHVG